MWMAGGGVKAGIQHGATDDYGYYAVERKMHIHDLHATILHLMGLNHEALTYRYAGRDFRLTDVAGEVARDIIARGTQRTARLSASSTGTARRRVDAKAYASSKSRRISSFARPTSPTVRRVSQGQEVPSERLLRDPRRTPSGCAREAARHPSSPAGLRRRVDHRPRSGHGPQPRGRLSCISGQAGPHLIIRHRLAGETMPNSPRYEIIIYWSDPDQASSRRSPSWRGVPPTAPRTGRRWPRSRSSSRNGSRRPGNWGGRSPSRAVASLRLTRAAVDPC
jgi:hypothetical protein